MQAVLALITLALGAIAWWQTGRLGFLAGGLLNAAAWPYTLLVVMPINHRLEAVGTDDAGGETRRLIERWGCLHAGRSGR